MDKERLAEIDKRFAELQVEKDKIPFYMQTKLLSEEAALRTELRAEFKRLNKAKRDVQIKESKRGLSDAALRAYAEEFIALQESQIYLNDKYPDLCRDGFSRPIYGRDTVTKQPPPIT